MGVEEDFLQTERRSDRRAISNDLEIVGYAHDLRSFGHMRKDAADGTLVLVMPLARRLVAFTT